MDQRTVLLSTSIIGAAIVAGSIWVASGASYGPLATETTAVPAAEQNRYMLACMKKKDLHGLCLGSDSPGCDALIRRCHAASPEGQLLRKGRD